MSDEDAYMALALNNAQGELHPLEEGMHAKDSGLSLRDYAERVGKQKTTMQHRMQAATVAAACTHMGTIDLRDYWRHLSEVHCAPGWLRPAIVSRLVSEELRLNGIFTCCSMQGLAFASLGPAHRRKARTSRCLRGPLGKRRTRSGPLAGLVGNAPRGKRGANRLPQS
jgi:hypothetical protein